MLFRTLTLVALFASSSLAADAKPKPLPVKEPAAGTKVEYATVAKILQKNCLACHSGTKAENSLVMESPQAMIKGGDSGPAIVPKKSAESMLFKLAAHHDDPVMPPRDNKVNAANLTPDELGLLKAWIDQGAEGQAITASPLVWQPLPAAVAPIICVAITPDGSLAAAGRGNEIVLMETATGRDAGRLIDPALSKQAGARGNIAHLDLVQSLAFHPSGELLASGGYREIKLWRKPNGGKHADLAAAGEAIKRVAVSPDNHWLAVGDNAGKVQLHDLTTNKVTQTLAAHTGPVTGLAFSLDNATLYTAGSDKQLRAYKVADGAEAGKFETPAAINGLALVTNGTQLATAEEDKLVRVWALPVLPAPAEAPKPVLELKGHNAAPVAIAGSPTSKYLATAEAAGQVKVWSLESKNQKIEYAHGGPVTAVAITADGKYVASAGENNQVKVVTIADNKPLPSIKGDGRELFKVAKLERDLSLAKARLEDRKKDVTESEALAKKETEAVPKAKEAKTAAEKIVTEKQEALKKPTADKEQADKDLKAATDLQVAKQVALKTAEDAAKADDKNADLQKTLKTAQTELKAEETKLEAAKKKVEDTGKAFKKATDDLQTADLAFKSSERGITAAEASVTKANKDVELAKASVTEADAAIKTAETKLKEGQAAAAAAEKPIRALAFAPNGAMYYTAGDDGLVQTWSTETGATLGVIAAAGKPVTAVALTANGVLSVTDKALTHWNPSQPWTLERTIGNADDSSTLADRVLALEFSPDGKLLASGGGEPSRSGEVKIWNPADGKLVKALTDPHSDTVFSVRWSPEGDKLATSGADRFMKIFDAKTGALIRAFEGHTHHVLAVAWHLNGRILATGSADNTIKVWDLRTGEQKRTVQGFSKEITSLSYLADSTRVIASGGDNSIKVNNVDNGGNERNLGGSPDFIYAAAASADGKTIVGGGQDGIIRIWEGTKNDPARMLDVSKK
jgi:WD40 repeat protein